MGQKLGYIGTKKQLVIQELNKLEELKGVIDPSDVVRLAKKEKSPLHQYFNWDDTEAAESYRLIQARILINQVSVVVDSVKQQAFLNVHVKNKRGYVSREVVLSDKQMQSEVVHYAAKQLKHWQDTYKDLAELEGVINEDILNANLE